MKMVKRIPIILVAAILLVSCAATPTGQGNTVPNTGSFQQATAAPRTVPLFGQTDAPAAAASATTTPTQANTESPTATSTTEPTQAPTAALTVTEVDVSPNLDGYSMASYNGSCQAAITFNANIWTNGAGTVTYFWTRSDGTSSPKRTLTFTEAGYQSVTDTWTYLSSNASVSASDQIFIDQPDHKAFQAAEISLTCNPALQLATPPSRSHR